MEGFSNGTYQECTSIFHLFSFDFIEFLVLKKSNSILHITLVPLCLHIMKIAQSSLPIEFQPYTKGPTRGVVVWKISMDLEIWALWSQTLVTQMVITHTHFSYLNSKAKI
jgi:hypothetical protein